MSFIKSTGNGTSAVISNLEERKRAIQRKDAGDAYRKQAEYYYPKAPSLAQLEDLLLGKKEREPETAEVHAAVREFQQIEHSQSRLQSIYDIKAQLEEEAAVTNLSVQSNFQLPIVFEEDLVSLQKKRLKEQAIAKYSYQVHMKRQGFVEPQSSFFRVA